MNDNDDEINTGKETAERSATKNRQFRLSTPMTIVTVTCVVLALPAGYVLLGTIIAWALLGALIMIMLILFQAPLFYLLSVVKQKKRS